MPNDYGHKHRTLRKHIAPLVDAGRAKCWRCQKPIEAGAAWDLGHDMDGQTRGPEHAACNRATYGRERPRADNRAPNCDTTRPW